MHVVPYIQLAIGNELLNGMRSDTNSADVARALRPYGLHSKEIVVAPDSAKEIAEALRTLSTRVPLVVVTGGLGPTEDDVTRDGFARFLDCRLVQHDPALKEIERKLTRRGLKVIPGNVRQALLPPKAMLLQNDLGSAPGFAVEVDGCLLAALPGVPAEMRGMLPQLVQLIQHKFRPGAAPAEYSLRFCRIRESELVDALAARLPERAGFELEYRLYYPEILLTVRQTDESARAKDAAQTLSQTLSEKCWACGPQTVEERVLALLSRAGQSVAVAESCSGGLLGATLTAVPGASTAFTGGAICYADQLKTGLLGVPAALIEEHGAVSPQVAAAMARGAREKSAASYGLAVSGIAGPAGGSVDKPVGTVELALAGEHRVVTASERFYGDRERVRRAAVFYSLLMLYKELGGPCAAELLTAEDTE